MANVKNFGLVGVGSDLQLGKAGTRIVNNAGTFNLKAANGTTDAALTAAGITSASGNVTLTTGNLVLSDNAGTIGIGGVTISRHTSGTIQIDGTGAFMVPSGTTAQRPTGSVGMIRSNSSNANSIEYFDGSTWLTLATGGSTGALQTEIDAIETAMGAAMNSDGTFNAAGFTGSAAGATSFTDAIQQVADAAAAKDTLDELFPALSAGNVIYANGSNEWAQAAPGATSGVQPYDTALASLAANATFGLVAQTDANTVVGRSLVAPAAGITITNAGGIAGNPTFALANDLAALEGLTTTGIIVRTGDGTAATRALTGAAGRISITDGDGVAGEPTIDLATVTDAGTGTFLKFTRDTYGRVSGTTAVVAGDITGLVDGTYVNVAGDTMAGNLSFGGTYKVTNLAEPTSASDAATKNYVDNAVSGLSWKQAVHVLSTTNVDIASPGATIDGHTLALGDRVLLTGQTTGSENGIYVFDTSTTPMTRAADADVYTELNGAAVFVQVGTYADTGWTQTATLTSFSGQTWVQFSGAGSYSAGDGLLLTGNVFSVNMGAGITTLPSDEVGIDIVANKAVQLTSTATGGQLTFVLDTGSGLEQSSSGLKISASGVTNAMLQNSTITLTGDTGSEALALGGTLHIDGNVTQGVSVAVTDAGGGTKQYAITVADATDTTKGVASFAAGEFTVTAGAVSLDTVPVSAGGTGVTSFAATQVAYGSATNTLAQNSAFTYTNTDGIDKLNVGGIRIGDSDPTGNALIEATVTNGDIVLMPNGTGSVVVGPVGAGLIESDTGTALTVRGNTGLTLSGGSGALTLTLPSGTSTSTKVTVSGPTAADYATNLDNEDLVNKYYVDQAIQSGAASGSIKAVKATITLDNGTTNVGAALPAGATVLSVKVQVTSTDTAATLEVGISGDVAKYMTSAENDLQSTGIYLAETYAVEASSVQVIATVAGSGEAGGSATVFVEYQVA